MKLTNNLRWAYNDLMFRREYQAGKVMLVAKPKFLIIDPTSRCNAHCVICSQSYIEPFKRLVDLSPSVFKKVQRFISAATQINLFSTGEPFLAPDFLNILKETQGRSSRRAQIWVSTNGKTVSAEALQAMQKPKMVLQFSVDGGTKEVFESIRSGILFAELCHTLDQVLRMKNGCSFPSVVFSCCISKRNIHDVGNIFILAKKYGIESVMLYDVTPPVPDEEKYVLDERDRGVFEAQRHIIESVGIQYSNCLTFRAPQMLETRTTTGNVTCTKAQCLAPWKVFHLHADGKVFPCCKLQMVMGDLQHQTFDEIWNGKQYINLRRSFIEQIGLQPECKNCDSGFKDWPS